MRTKWMTSYKNIENTGQIIEVTAYSYVVSSED